MGNEVNDSRKPYQEGMVFRCNLDGSEFETLGWNFRNNWEVCVDSFGAMWQSDNDDDGNRGVRINYVMEYGNYGYKDEFTGAAWNQPRTNWEEEIPLRHWHLNDPGVVPNLLQTGAGAPTGICLYEGDLLPMFKGHPIHTDAGPNVCRAYVTKPSGAGYTAEIVNILNGARNQWFRPSDVCVAPDGSLLVADWYDPGVGGHRMQDAAHGRIFRVHPQGKAEKYVTAKVDVTTADGAAAALRSPNMATRYLAWTALHSMGPGAVAVLESMWNGNDPVMQARALGVLVKLGLGKEATLKYVAAGLSSSNSDIRCATIRLARQLGGVLEPRDVAPLVKLDDPSPAVRRELLIGLRELFALGADPNDLTLAWVALAKQYDGQDRWYLEALGIAAEGNWDRVLPAYLATSPSFADKAVRDIVWRSRAERTPELLLEIIRNPNTPESEIPRYLRAFDFLKGSRKTPVLTQLAFGSAGSDQRTSLVNAEAMNRLENFDLNAKPEYKAALAKVLQENAGTERFVRLVGQFNLAEKYPDLLKLARENSTNQLAVNSIKTLYDKQQSKLIREALQQEDRDLVDQTFAALTTAADGRSTGLLLDIVNDNSRPVWVRRGAVKAAAASLPGAQKLLEIAQSGTYDPPLKETLAAALTTVQWKVVTEPAMKLFPPPPGKSTRPLPSIPELAARSGDVGKGRVIYHTTGTCNKCHQVNGLGVEIGPNLSEIGKKLAKPAFYESILYPSAAISHGFENWLVVTNDGQVITGLLINETATEIQIKDDKGILRAVPLVNIEERKKQDVSLMPADIQKLMTEEELVDLVEYLTTLKERSR